MSGKFRQLGDLVPSKQRKQRSGESHRLSRGVCEYVRPRSFGRTSVGIPATYLTGWPFVSKDPTTKKSSSDDKIPRVFRCPCRWLGPRPRQFSESRGKFYKQIPVSNFDACLDRFQVRGTNNNFCISLRTNIVVARRQAMIVRDLWNFSLVRAKGSSSSLGTFSDIDEIGEPRGFRFFQKFRAIHGYAFTLRAKCLVVSFIR